MSVVLEEELSVDGSADEEETEPQVTSSDPNERKLARKLRLKKRLDAIARRQWLQSDEAKQLGVVELKEKVGIVDLQLEESAEVLEKLFLEGKELVTNIRVANDSREVKRRQDEAGMREELLEKLEEESDLALEQFNAISAHWADIAKSSDPLQLDDGLAEQKANCDKLILQKDEVIKELRKELDRADLRFAADQQKQADDIAELIKRIDTQVLLMRKAYKEQLGIIENAVDLERVNFKAAQEKKWEQLYKQRDNDEEKYMMEKFEQVEQYENDLNQVNLDHQEQYRELRIQLEGDIQQLRQELEMVKATCLMNSEKLDYNFQVLKRREDENKIVRSQQKRRLNKLQDTINSIRRKIVETQKTSEMEIKKLTDDVVRLHDNILDVEVKADHFAAVNDQIYHKIWRMNDEELQGQLEDILSVDRVLHEQQLGLTWNSPELQLLNKEQLPSYIAALEMLAEMKKSEQPGQGQGQGQSGSSRTGAKSKTSVRRGEEKEVERTPSEEAVFRVNSARLLRHILQRVADSTGFFVEERLHEILRPYTETDRTLVFLDNVFSALGVKSVDDILELRKYFIPYAYCPICTRSTKDLASPDENVEREIKVDDFSVGSESSSGTISLDNICKPKEKRSGSSSDSKYSGENTSEESLRVLEQEAEDIVKLTRPEDHSGDSWMILQAGSRDTMATYAIQSMKSSMMRTVRCQDPARHPLQIDSVYAIRALRDFTEHFFNTKVGDVVTMTMRLARRRHTVSRLLSEEDVTMFWDRFRDIFSDNGERLWDSLLIGLKKFYGVLQDRARLNYEIQLLKGQHCELKKLLCRYSPPPDCPANPHYI